MDINGDGKTDYCRIIGSLGQPQIACNLSTGYSFGETLVSDKFGDLGYPGTRGWTGNKKAGYYCRGVGNDEKKFLLSCQGFVIKGNKLELIKN